MANSRIPGPLSNDFHPGAHGKSWCEVGCQRGHTPGPVRVADAPKNKSNKPAPISTKTIIWHVYETLIPPQPGYPQGYNKEALKAWFNASDDTRLPDGPGKWDAAGITLEWNTDPKTGSKILKSLFKGKGLS